MAWRDDDKFASKVSQSCREVYEKLTKKKGKSTPKREWSLLACVVATFDTGEQTKHITIDLVCTSLLG